MCVIWRYKNGATPPACGDSEDGVVQVSLLTPGVHVHIKGYCSCPMCVCVCLCVCVHFNLPPHALESQMRDTNGFIAIQNIL